MRMSEAMVRSGAIIIEADSQAFEVYCVITREVLDLFEMLPKEYLKQASQAIETWVSSGGIHSYQYFPNRLSVVWNLLASSTHPPPVRVLIAQGAPIISRISIEPIFRQPLAVGLLTISPVSGPVSVSRKSDAKRDLLTTKNKVGLSKARLAWIVLNLNRSLARHDASLQVNPTRIQSLLLQHILSGRKIESERVSAPPKKRLKQKKITINSFTTSDYVEIVVASSDAINTEAKIDSIINDIYKAVDGISNKVGFTGILRVMEKYLRQEFARVMSDHRRLGVDMPISMLAGIGVHPNYQGLGVSSLKFEVDILLNLMPTDVSKAPVGDVHQAIYPIARDDLQKIMSKLQQAKIVYKSNGSEVTYRLSQIRIPATRIDVSTGLGSYSYAASKMALTALDTIDSKLRSFQSLTLTVNKSHVPQLIHKISEFRNLMVCRWGEQDSKSRLFTLNMQFVPFTRPAAESSGIRQEDCGRDTSGNKNSHWVTTVIRESVALRDFHFDAHWICARLRPNVSLLQVETALKRLQSSGMMIYDDATRTYHLVNENVQTEAEVPGQSIRDFHRCMILVACEVARSPLKVPVDLSTSRLWLRESDVPEVKLKINAFIENVMNDDQQLEGADEIYQFNFQMFPLSEGGMNSDK